MQRFGIILETFLASLHLFLVCKSAVLLFLEAALLYNSFNEKRKSQSRSNYLVFFPHHPHSFSPKKSMDFISFHHLLVFLSDLSNSCTSSQIWKVFFAPMGDLTSFSKPSFLPIRIESLCFQIYDVIIYLDRILLHELGLCTLIQYNFLLCSIFSLLFVEFCMFDQ